MEHQIGQLKNHVAGTRVDRTRFLNKTLDMKDITLYPIWCSISDVLFSADEGSFWAHF